MDIFIIKPDLDTCLTATILGAKEHDRIMVINQEASHDLLGDPEVICIEAGGSGLVELNNYDHHDPHQYHPPACRQALVKTGKNTADLSRLVDYVCCVDEARPMPAPIPFPSLSALFSGMCICTPGIRSRFRTGIELCRKVLAEGIDPFSRMPSLSEWDDYLRAK
jgi:hypothetical protein